MSVAFVLQVMGPWEGQTVVQRRCLRKKGSNPEEVAQVHTAADCVQFFDGLTEGKIVGHNGVVTSGGPSSPAVVFHISP